MTNQMFCSRTRFNDDEEPWVFPDGGRHDFPHFDNEELRYDPRPEFDRPQHNPTNQVLVIVRERVADIESAGIRSEEYDLWLSAISGDDPDSYAAEDRALVLAQPAAHREHALRVLSRLVTA